LLTADFDFQLPPDRVAAAPSPTRDGARLFVMRRDGGSPNEHAHFRDVGGYLPPRSLLVLNDTRVLPARLRGHKATGGAFELLLTRCVASDRAGDGYREIWESLGRGLQTVAIGSTLDLGRTDLPLRASILERREEGRFLVALEGGGAPDLVTALDRLGELPLPPYIEAARREAGPGAPPVDDRDRYQTVYARAPGAVAAPTAGLHFTPQTLRALEAAGHELASVTLHVGPGTFRPVKTEDPRAHRLDEEHFVIPQATADAIARARAQGRPVFAVGTTVVRTLEASARANGGRVAAGEGATDLYILPGDTFAVVDGLVTNFHLPQSTLLMLVCAFAGRDRVMAAYREAVERGYRFYSYGDSMLILPRAA
jgi:S-adenosylmethionine:tRNA ribosyltransferase-isomerase